MKKELTIIFILLVNITLGQYDIEQYDGYTFSVPGESCNSITINPTPQNLDITYYTGLRRECLWSISGFCIIQGDWIYDEEINLGNKDLIRVTNIDCKEKDRVCFDVENAYVSSINTGSISGLVQYTSGSNTVTLANFYYGKETNLCLSYTSPLPIELISFKGINKGRFNKLMWVTASEHNNDYFTLEYSIDGINWINIGNIKGAGNNQVKTEYTYDHHLIFNEAVIYYRLSQTDFNGKRKVFNPISVLLDRVEYEYYDLLGRKISNPKGIVIQWDGFSYKKVY